MRKAFSSRWAYVGSMGVAVAISVAPLAGHGQSWKPATPVELTVPSGAGAALDNTARTLQSILEKTKAVDAPIVIVNKPGGGQAVGLSYLERRAANGMHLAMSTPNLLTNHIMGHSTFDHTAITGVAMLLTEYYAFVVRTDAGVKSGSDLAARLRDDSAALSIGISNIGGAGHIAVARAVRLAGGDVRKMKTVVFNSGGAAVTALLGGHVDLVASSLSNVWPQVQAGKLRAIAITAPRRLDGVLAGLPTWKEQGLDLSMGGWQGVVGPRGMKPVQLAFWDHALSKLVGTEEWKRFREHASAFDYYMSSRDTQKALASEYAELKTLFLNLGLSK